MNEQKSALKRLEKLLAAAFAVLACGFLYAFIVSKIGFGIPCLFRLATGLKCPGCGVSRMCLSLLRLDFRAAWHYNSAVMLLSPLAAVVFCDMSLRYVLTGTQKPDKFSNFSMFFMVIVLVAFGILRNL